MIIAVTTNKGGTLKTSISVNISGLLARAGQRVLIVDTDNQGNAALSFGRNPDDFGLTLYDVLVDPVAPLSAIYNVYENIDLLPSNDSMAFFEFDVLTDREKYPAPFTLLKDALQSLRHLYDVIIIDSPPNMGLTQGNVLTAADHILIPFQPENYSMRSLVKILKAIQDFREQYNPGLSILGIVPTLVNSRTVLHSQVLQECRAYAEQNNVRIFDTVIPQSVRFAAAVAYEGLPAVLSSDKNNNIVKSYEELLEELNENIKGMVAGGK